MTCFENLYQHIKDNSTSYLLAIIGYGSFLYGLWVDTKKIIRNIIQTILNFFIFTLTLMDINNLQITNLFRDKIEIEQEKYFLFLKEFSYILRESLKRGNPSDKNFVNAVYSSIKTIKEDLEKNALKEEEKKIEEGKENDENKNPTQNIGSEKKKNKRKKNLIKFVS